MVTVLLSCAGAEYCLRHRCALMATLLQFNFSLWFVFRNATATGEDGTQDLLAWSMYPPPAHQTAYQFPWSLPNTHVRHSLHHTSHTYQHN